MAPIILRHLDHVSCLFGYSMWNNANAFGTNLSEPPTNAAMIDHDLVAPDDPEGISLYDDVPPPPPQPTCPTNFCTFMPPCIHR